MSVGLIFTICRKNQLGGALFNGQCLPVLTILWLEILFLSSVDVRLELLSLANGKESLDGLFQIEKED